MKKHHYFAFLIVFVIALIHLHPYFFGKVDIPLDLRDVRMYPWRFHAVDQKIKNIKLWNGQFSSSPFILQVKPNETKKVEFDLILDKLQTSYLGQIKDGNYSFYLDFKIENEKTLFDFGINLINKSNGESYFPGATVVPLNEYSWYKAEFQINKPISKLKKINELSNYKVDIVAKGKENSVPTIIYLKNFYLLCQDYSSVQKIHNHYLTDLIQMFPLIREYFSSSLKKGKLPFWNNYLLTGVEFLTEPQVGFFHPLYFLAYFLFDYFTAQAIMNFLSLVLCGIGAYLLFSFWRFGFFPSLLTAIVYMFHPFNVTDFTYGHMIMNSAALPFLMLMHEKNLSEKKYINKYLLISAFLLGTIFLSGHLQYVYYTVLFFFFFINFRFICALASRSKNIQKHILSIFFIFFIGLLIGSIVLVPFLSLFQNSHRPPTSEGFIRLTSIPLSAFLGLFTPFYKGLPDWPLAGYINITSEFESYRQGFSRNYIYFGLLPFLLSLFSLKSLLKKDKLTIFFFSMIIISLLVCMGSPLFFLVKDIIPGFKEMQHYRFTMIYCFAVPFLAGIGFHVLLNYCSFIHKKLIYIVASIIILISAFDLMHTSSFFITWSKRSDYKPLPKGGSLEFLVNEQNHESEPFRVLSFVSEKINGNFVKADAAKPNTLQAYMIEDVSGYSSFIPKDLYYLFVYVQTKDKSRLYSGKIFDLFPNVNAPYPITNYHSQILDLLNVKYFLVPNFLTLGSNDVRKVFSGDADVYENLDYLPRAFIVPNYEVIESNIDAIVKLDSDAFDPRKDVILMTSVIARSDEVTTKQSPNATRNEIASSALSEPPRNDAQFVNYQPDNITLKVNTNKPGFLVLGHNLNNNWKVKINGKESRHIQANLVQRAVYLPHAGKYLIEFYYFPKLFLVGLFITLTGIFILIVLGIILTLKMRNKE